MFTYTKEISNMALGNQKVPLVLKNGKVVQVFTNEIIEADVAIADGYIIGVGSYRGEQEIDLAGKYVCPGFIDAHLHLESSLVNPGELIEQASLQGTTTFIVDPHEAANVAGTAGIDYILAETEESQANVYVMVPSCVPAGPFEDNGCPLTAKEMERYVDH
ncbi:MAG: adenine deaminase, partial [Clostridia bacterium]|nr:adenine deaminase [Clostridia bacterium]